MLLHDQREVPMMRNQGIAVPPGSHTLVAVKMSTVSVIYNMIIKMSICMYVCSREMGVVFLSGFVIYV